MQEKVQNWTTTTLPRRPAGVSGAELSQAVAPPRSGSRALDGQLGRRGHRSDLKVARISSREDLRLLPGGEVAAFVDLVVVDELGIRPLRPALRGRIQLVGEDGHADRDLDALGVEEGQLALPVEPRRGDRRVRQPVVGDVVEDVVAREAAGLPGEGARDELVAARRRGRASRRPGRPGSRRCRRASAAGWPSRWRSRRRSRRSGPARSYAVFSSAERPAGGGSPIASARETSGGTVAGMFVWMPSRPGGFNSAICSVTALPQSPPCATNSVYPSRLISSTQARAMRMGSQPVSVGLPENPWPGSDGITRWKASDALAPCAVGFGERVDDLQLLDRRARPPVRDDERQRVLVLGADVDEVDVHPVDLGDEVREGREAPLERCASRSPSPSSRRVPGSSSSRTPCEGSTSRSGHLVAVMRRRRSSSCSSGTSNVNGRMSMACSSRVWVGRRCCQRGTTPRTSFM